MVGSPLRRLKSSRIQVSNLVIWVGCLCLKGISYLSIEEEKAVRAKIPALRNMDFANSSNNATGNGSTAAPTVDVSEVNVDAAAKEVVDKNTCVFPSPNSSHES